MSASDSAPEVPGFADHLGERFIVPQPSGSLLEFLHFRPDLAAAPFFEAAVKDRMARLANFRHSSYTRVRRFQRGEDRGGAALVSTHVPGRRLAEILQIAARAGMTPPPVATLALARQLMTAAALMHDYGPDIFHGALTPERLILPGEGRVVVCEYVLGAVFEQAAPAWGLPAVWRDWRVPTLSDAGLARYGRRVDLLQIGLIVLAFMLGRSLSASDYPEALPRLLDEASAGAAAAEAAGLAEPLRGWLASLLFPEQPSAFRTLVEAQKAFGALLPSAAQAGEASPSTLQAFLDRCEAVAFPPSSDAGRPAGPTPETLKSAAAMLEAASAARGQPPAAADVLFPPSGDGRLAGEPTVAAPEPATDWFTPSGDYAGFDQSPCDVVPAFEVTQEPAPLAPDLPESSGLAELAAEAEPALLPAQEAEPPVQPEPAADQPQLAAEMSAPFPQPPVAGPATTDGPAQVPAPVHDELPRPEPRHTTPRVRPASGSQHGGGVVRPAVSARREIPWRKIVLAACALLVIAAAAVVAPMAWTRIMGGAPPVGHLAVESTPPGAEVVLDGKPAGRTPANLETTAGQHHVEVRVGGSSRAAWVSVPEGGAFVHRVSLPEAAIRGGLRLVTNPPGGTVSVDGKDHGKTPVRVDDLVPGPHRVVATGPFGPVEQEVAVVGGEMTEVTVPTVGWVRVRAPYPLRVSEQGRLYGETSGQSLMVPAGRHHFDLANPTLALKVRQFADVQPGTVVTIPFEAPMGMMNLSSDEPAQVWLDGRLIGQTPLTTLPVALGSHEVVFRHERLGDVRYAVNVTLAAPVRLVVTFKKK